MEEQKRVNRIPAMVGVFFTAWLVSLPVFACEIEDWSYQSKANALYISGATTCKEGQLTLRVYDGNTDEFLASDYTYIEGYAFQIYIDSRVPSSLNIKYSID